MHTPEMEPCRFHFTGGCARGAACRFSHDDAPLSSVACPYHGTAAGCKYGAACQFRHDRSVAAAARPAPPPLPDLPSGDDLCAPGFGDDGESDAHPPAPSSLVDAATAEWGGLRIVDDSEPSAAAAAAASPWAAAVAASGASPPTASTLAPPPSDLCGQWAAAGACTRGDRCHLVHGNWCKGCGRYALHPTDAGAAAEHAAACAAEGARTAAAAAAASIECGICLERTLAKPGRPGERRFGLLACDHAFCLGCIRSWRGQVHSAGAMVDVGAARGCPECRVRSHIVVPSATWPASREEKEAIFDAYKAALGRTPCRNWDAGRGTCPHGSSCLYLHVDERGVPVDRAAGLRWVGDEEGVVKPMTAVSVRLGDFLAGGQGGRRRR